MLESHYYYNGYVIYMKDVDCWTVWSVKGDEISEYIEATSTFEEAKRIIDNVTNPLLN